MKLNMKVAVIGFGYWGPNLVRNFSTLPGVEVKAIVEAKSERQTAASRAYPKAQILSTPEPVFQDDSVDAVVIATPVATHFPLAKAALQRGKHVLVEKPLTSSSEEAAELLELARKNGRVLMVDHTFLYTGAIEKLKSMISSGELGVLQYFDSTRINLGLFQSDVNVLWDLAAHDLSILTYLHPEKPRSVHAVGQAHLASRKENIAYLSVQYESGMFAHFHCSWVSPVKIRKMLIGGDRKMVVYDDMEPSEKLKVYDTGFQERSDEARNQILVDYRTGDIHIPKLPMKEALAGLAEDFRRAVTEGTKPRSNAESGLEVVRILEAAERSLRERGKEILL